MVTNSNNHNAAVQAAPPRVVLPVLMLTMFSTIFNLRVLGPILVDISVDFKISVATAGSLAVAYALPFAIAALFVGPLSDKYGRRRMMVIGISTLALAALGAMVAPSFIILMIMRSLAGFGAAVLQPAVLASVGDYFPYAQRGRAMSWVIVATTMSTVLGVPTGTFLAGIFTWRWIFGFLGIILIIATIFVVTQFPDGKQQTKQSAGSWEQYKSNFGEVFHNRSAMFTLLSTLFFGMFWQGWNTFSGAFFIQTFSLSTKDLAPIYMIQGLGVLIGSYIGGILGDRLTKKVVIVVALFIGGLIMTQITSLIIALWLTLAFVVLMAIGGGVRFAAGNALATEQVPEARGTMMAVNASANQLGNVIGSSTGSMLINIFGGYTPLGWAFGGFAMISSLLIKLFVKDSNPEQEESAVHV
jgi:predicted MFS family arabinose efflux permease